MCIGVGVGVSIRVRIRVRVRLEGGSWLRYNYTRQAFYGNTQYILAKIAVLPPRLGRRLRLPLRIRLRLRLKLRLRLRLGLRPWLRHGLRLRLGRRLDPEGERGRCRYNHTKQGIPKA